MPDIVVAEFMDETIAREGFTEFDLLFDPALVDDEARLLDAASDARALIVRNRTQVRGALLERAAKLEVVGRLGVGLDNIDVEACAARDIAVEPARGANDLSVAEYVITAALVLLRGAWQSTPQMLEGAWPRNALIGGEAAGKTMGLIGFGAIARETAKRAIALGMRVAAYDPYLSGGQTSIDGVDVLPTLDAIASASDVISLHTPLTEETRHLVNEAFLSNVKPTTVIINAARGGVVDEPALASAIRSGGLAGAALDVFETEPLTAAAAAPFQGLENVILTPHIAGVTAESNLRVSEATVANVLRVLKTRSPR